ncbi:hypothetical protein SH139x_001740 [Planctomycetaceae bacterium SH139]
MSSKHWTSDPIRLFRLKLSAIRYVLAELMASRIPLFVVRFVGVFLLRFADRQFDPVLFELPPRKPRFEPLSATTESFRIDPVE